MKCPLVLEQKNGNKLYFVKVLSDFKGFSFLYKFEDANYFLVLNPKKIEKKYINRPRPKKEVVNQDPFGCVVASIAMLVQKSKAEVGEVFKQQGIEYENGVNTAAICSTLRLLGFSSEVSEERSQGPCLFSVESLNVRGMYHSLYFDGEEILDPQMGNEGCFWYASDWSPEAIGGFEFISVLPLRN